MVNETATYNLDGFEDVGCPMNFTIISPSEYPEITLESPTYAPATSQYPFALNVQASGTFAIDTTLIDFTGNYTYEYEIEATTTYDSTVSMSFKFYVFVFDVPCEYAKWNMA